MDLETHLTKLGIEPVIGNQLFLMGEGEIAELERPLGVRLPETYRTFLSTHGASGFWNIICFHPVQPLPAGVSSNGDGPFDFFYGPTTDAGAAYDCYSLADVITCFADRMPESLIPIGGDMMDSQICLGIRGAETGKVYLWDIENEWGEEDYTNEGLPVPPDLKFQNVHLIADSFEDFLLRLYVSDYGE